MASTKLAPLPTRCHDSSLLYIIGLANRSPHSWQSPEPFVKSSTILDVRSRLGKPPSPLCAYLNSVV